MNDLYVIAGCNGAGKTTASYTILPEILNCREFVNADNIAAGLSPFNPEGVAFEAGRIMLARIYELIEEQQSFAFETTLATRSYVSLLNKAKSNNYKITLVFFWLSSPQLARERVISRVEKGGHNIPEDVIERRYYRGIRNFFNLFMPVCDTWLFFDNSKQYSQLIARGYEKKVDEIKNVELWNVVLTQTASNEKGKY